MTSLTGSSADNPFDIIVNPMTLRRSAEGAGNLECTQKLRQEIKGPATVNGGEQCWCPDKNIPAN